MFLGLIDVAVEIDHYPLELRVRVYKLDDGYVVLLFGKLRIIICIGDHKNEIKQDAVRTNVIPNSGDIQRRD
jgi:hypothetical protein